MAVADEVAGVEPVLELGALKGKENVEDVLRRVGVAHGEVGLEQIESRRRPVPVGIVTRRDEFNDLCDVTVRAEIAGNRNEHIGAVPRGRKHFLINHESARQIFFFKFSASLDETRNDTAGTRSRKHFGFAIGCIDRRWTGFFRGEAVKKSHAPELSAAAVAGDAKSASGAAAGA